MSETSTAHIPPQGVVLQFVTTTTTTTSVLDLLDLPQDKYKDLRDLITTTTTTVTTTTTTTITTTHVPISPQVWCHQFQSLSATTTTRQDYINNKERMCRNLFPCLLNWFITTTIITTIVIIINLLLK